MLTWAWFHGALAPYPLVSHDLHMIWCTAQALKPCPSFWEQKAQPETQEQELKTLGLLSFKKLHQRPLQELLKSFPRDQLRCRRSILGRSTQRPALFFPVAGVPLQLFFLVSSGYGCWSLWFQWACLVPLQLFLFLKR